MNKENVGNLFCKNCEYLYFSGKPVCINSLVGISLVTGERKVVEAEDCRSNLEMCGRDGNWFVTKRVYPEYNWKDDR